MDFKTRTIIYEYKLSDLESEIAFYILEHQEQVQQMKINVLAGKFYTATNTISRLCHKLGYSGFLEMKRDLWQKSVTSSEIPDYQEVLRRNFEIMDSEKMQEVVSLFKKARRVKCYGMSTTAYAVRIIVDHFNCLDFKFSLFEDLNDVKEKMKLMKIDASEVLFFVSLSGESEPLLSVAKYLRARGQTIVTLTNLSENSLSQVGQVNLYCYSPERLISGTMRVPDKAPLLIVMDQLFHLYAKEALNG